MVTLTRSAWSVGGLGSTARDQWRKCPGIVALPSDLVLHELYMTMTSATQETLVEIVDEIFLPLATNFGNDTQSED
jgi:hypothetical protein